MSEKKHVKLLKLFNSRKMMKVGRILATSKKYFFTPFTFNHGISRLASDPDNMRYIVRSLSELIKDKKIKFDLIGGIASAGISFAAVLAQQVNKPFVYIRKKPEYIDNNLSVIEGDWNRGQKILLVDNIIGKGKNTMAVIKQLRKEGLKVRDILVVADWQGVKIDWYKRQDIKFHSLVTLEEVVKYLCQTDYFPAEIKPYFLDYVRNPRPWAVGSKKVKEYNRLLEKYNGFLVRHNLLVKG